MSGINRSLGAQETVIDGLTVLNIVGNEQSVEWCRSKTDELFYNKSDGKCTSNQGENKEMKLSWLCNIGLGCNSKKNSR